MKNTITLFLILVFVCKCRYKNNDTLSLQLVKTRLQKTWILKEGIRDGVDVTSYYLNEELTFSNVSNTNITIQHSGRVGTTFDFTHRKTIISFNEYKLKITKLTNKELWMEGNCIGGFIGSGFNNIIKVKYTSK